MTVSQKVAHLKAAKSKKSKTHFVQDMKDEMKRVSWTTKDELRTCTKIVLGAIFALGLGIYGIDLLIRNVIQGIEGLSRLVG